jgi:hypothetical protein
MSFFALLDPDPTEQSNADPFGSATLGRDYFFFEEKQSRRLTNQPFFSFQKALLELNKSPLFQSIISPDTRSLGVSLGSEDLNSNIMNIPQVDSQSSND